jgi:YibE/F-like protein
VTRGMRIGRDHLASTVYTLAFAYAGVSLPILLLVQAYDRPLTHVITALPIAQDVIGILVGGIGLTLAIPLTTLVAALVAGTSTIAPAPVSFPIPPANGEGEFEEGLLLRRRRRRDERTADGRLDRPDDDDQLGLDATDWSSWPT